MPDDFVRITGSLDAPMVVVTTSDGLERCGCLVGFHTQCSIAPRRWLVCISRRNRTYRVAAGAHRLAVHLLHDDQHALAELFGEETDDTVDKFARCAWHAGPEGIPIVDGCDYFVGAIRERLELGDHAGYVLDVTEAVLVHPPGAQLGFQSVRRLHPGHPP